MTSQIKVNDSIPASQTLMEYIISPDSEQACALKPTAVNVSSQCRNKTIVVVAVPGAFTPTCSERHIPPYIARVDELTALNVDEVWVVSVNDPFVMAYWGQNLRVDVSSSVKFLSDGNGTFVQSLGLEKDATAAYMGSIRSKRWSMVLVDGVVKRLNVEEAGKFEVSDIDTTIRQLDEMKEIEKAESTA